MFLLLIKSVSYFVFLLLIQHIIRCVSATDKKLIYFVFLLPIQRILLFVFLLLIKSVSYFVLLLLIQRTHFVFCLYHFLFLLLIKRIPISVLDFPHFLLLLLIQRTNCVFWLFRLFVSATNIAYATLCFASVWSYVAKHFYIYLTFQYLNNKHLDY